MFKVVTLFTLLIQLPNDITTLGPCKPNTQFVLNGRLCYCDNRGYWTEANCKTINRRQSCQPGQIIWQGCNQCICQENGYLVCSNSHCSDDFAKPSASREGLSMYGLHCTPYRSYYLNCSICVCPASGIAKEAQCVSDISCNSQKYGTEIGGSNKIYCIPNVMYLSPCMHCLCPENGYFNSEGCVEKCKQLKVFNSPERRCSPGTLFRNGCYICKCPDSSIIDVSLCISTPCNNVSLNALRTDSKSCHPHAFTEQRCMYCNCHATGEVNEDACVELDCAKSKQLGKQNADKPSCHPGEMQPICTECFCTRDGQTIAKYCSKICSYQNRINILEIVLKDANNIDIIDWSQIKRVREDEECTPNSLYLDSDRYCLCPENGDKNFKFCTSITKELKTFENHEVLNNNVEIDYNSPCEPNTFVEFDCNTCYCAKNGKIDPKWCTYDDCEGKRLIQEAHKKHNPPLTTDASGTCQPGAVSKLKCNFCICPESGILKEKACTQNDCTEFDHNMYEYDDKLTCEPLAYYEVDCNICYCPRDGIKNVAKCTKNHCEKNVLRSDSCVPGQLFSDDCNLCVCPPDGNKMGKACTNHVCPKMVPEKLFILSDDLEKNHNSINYSRSLDHCFPGEEFIDGCNLCICPELGLKMYATCESILCDEEINDNHDRTYNLGNKTKKGNVGSVRNKRSANECYIYNVTSSAERKDCTPGTMYIIRCRECICPYFGNINNFCRPLPKNMYCEQAFPYFNYLPMGRRRTGELINLNNTKYTNSVQNGTSSTKKSKETIQIKVKHDKHTEYKCDKPGRILDKCFICNCEERNVVIEEHCFKSDAIGCENARPNFLFTNKLDL